MNRIETRIIMMVTNRLSAAKDSEEKTELIEELSENLYQRYTDLTAGGVSEEEAFAQAMENLGDVDELLTYLENAGGEDTQAGQGKAQDSRGGFSFDNLGSSIEDVVNMAISSAKTAMDYGRDVARDVSEQMREKYSDGVFTFTLDRGQKVDCTSIESEGLHSLEVRLTNGDIQICFVDDPQASVEVSGDTEEIETIRREDGVLTVRQGSTASSSFLFTRGVRSSDIIVRLPNRAWNNISLATVNGDIRIDEGLECNGLAVQSTSGDVRAAGLTSGRMAFKMTSGDIDVRDVNGDLYAESKSGDIRVKGLLRRCGLSSASGDVRFEGNCEEANCSSISGDVELIPYNLPDKMKASTKSGDCTVRVPSGDGFRVIYRTVSGEFNTNLPLTLNGVQRGKGGEAIYLDGGCHEIQMSSVSGDLEVLG
ncbi:MAG: DUF4097 domain-containing protein [Lachnospiraceae bacterium]|nr:DUF4097 domain-containing protein [Lachnospiraceae bacterium]